MHYKLVLVLARLLLLIITGKLNTNTHLDLDTYMWTDGLIILTTNTKNKFH